MVYVDMPMCGILVDIFDHTLTILHVHCEMHNSYIILYNYIGEP